MRGPVGLFAAPHPSPPPRALSFIGPVDPYAPHLIPRTRCPPPLPTLVTFPTTAHRPPSHPHPTPPTQRTPTTSGFSLGFPSCVPPARFREPINIQACGDPYCVGVSGAGWRAPFPLRGCFIILEKVLAFKTTAVSISHPLIILTASVTLKTADFCLLEAPFY